MGGTETQKEKLQNMPHADLVEYALQITVEMKRVERESTLNNGRIQAQVGKLEVENGRLMDQVHALATIVNNVKTIVNN